MAKRWNSVQILRISARIGQDTKIGRRDVIAYILNMFISGDKTSISNNHLIKHLYCNKITVIKIIKILLADGIISRETKVSEKDGCFRSYRVLRLSPERAEYYIKLDQEKIGKNPSGPSTTQSSQEELDAEAIAAEFAND